MQKKYNILFCLIILIIILAARFLFLDCDVPPMKLTLLYSLDEGPYAMPAFNILHHGTYCYHFLPGEPAFELIGSFLLNILVYPGLLLFGNNYWGFRISSVLVSLLIIFIFSLVLKRINKNQPLLSLKNISFFILIYFITDFSFLANSRVVEPTLYRMLAMMIVIFCFVYKNKLPASLQQWFPLIIGFISSLAVFFVYVYNIFIIPAVFLTLFIQYFYFNKKQISRLFLLFTLGVSFGFALFLFYLKFAGNMNFKEYLTLLGGASDRLTHSKGGGILKAIGFFILNIGKSTFMDLSTNIFFLNPALLFLFLVSIPVYIKKMLSEKSEMSWIIFSLIGFLFLQTWFENSFSSRRLVLFLPLVLIVIADSLGSLKSYKESLPDIKLHKFKIYFILIAAISLLLYLATKIFYSYFFRTEAKYQIDFFIVIFIHIIAIAIIVGVWQHLKKQIKPLTRYVLLLLLLFPNIYFAAKYIYINPKFQNRDAMIAMAPKINGQLMLGGFSYSYQLYNTSVPVLSIFLKQYGDSIVKKAFLYNFNNLIETGKGKYSLRYMKSYDANGEIIEITNLNKNISDTLSEYVRYNSNLVQAYIINQNLSLGLYELKIKTKDN